MNIVLFSLPIDDPVLIVEHAALLTAAKRNGVQLAYEQLDWLDFADNYIRDLETQ